MGHIVNSDREYRLFQQKLDQSVTGAPESPVFMKILKMLLSPEEAELARKIPTMFTSLEKLSDKLGIPSGELEKRMIDMAYKGFVIDVEFAGTRYFSLAPVVIGFFEFTFMRTRDDLPMKELAKLFEEYMVSNDKFARSVFQGQTQIGRAMVREEALPGGDFTEILDWELTSHIISSASSLGVSLCACRHKASHLGKACDAPMETCLTFNIGAQSMIRSGIARSIDKNEAMDILHQCKEAGLMQTGDNVQKKLTYVCNCCGCCCGMITSMKTFNIKNAIVSSNWIMDVDEGKCKGCGKCNKACPADAVSMVRGDGPGVQKKAKLSEDMCLGCGVCKAACKFGAISLKPRKKRVYTPETVFDRVVAMAIERGKLANLLFEDTENISYKAIGRVIGMLEKSPPFKAAMAVEPLRSAFLKNIVDGAKRKAGAFGQAAE